MQTPYISITDVPSAEFAERALDVLVKERSRHLLGVGVMMSHKTLRGIESSWSGVYPPKERVAEIFPRQEGVLNTLHYADYKGNTTSDDLVEAIGWGGENLNAVQLDMPWPDERLLEKARDAYPHLSFIIQVSGVAMDQIDNDIRVAADRLRGYDALGCLQYVLLDQSMGKGKLLDPRLVLSCMQSLRRHIPETGFVAAGGLGPYSVERIRTIVRWEPNVSIDAQGRLRESGDAQDPIDWKRAELYLRRAVQIFRECDRSVAV